MAYRSTGSRRARWVAVGVLWLVLALLWLADWVCAFVLAGYPHAVSDFVLLGCGPVFAALVVVPGHRVTVASRAVLAAAGSWTETAALAVFPGHGTTVSWGFMESGALLVLLGITARRVEPIRRAVALCVVLGFAIIAAPLREAHHGYETVIYTILITVAVATAVVVGGYVRSLDVRRGWAMARVRQAERLELARELHDFVAHHVTGIVVQAQAAQTIRQCSPEQVDDILRSIETAGMETLDSMRRLVRVLREQDSRTVRRGELFADLTDLVADFSRCGGPDPTLQITAAARRVRLAPEVAISVQRVLQETLTNVRRHAPGAAATVAVRLDERDERLTVEVGNGPSVQRVVMPVGGIGGLGLVGLAERVDAVGGSFTAGPVVGGGWRVLARFPVLEPIDG